MPKALTPTAPQPWTHPDYVPVGDPSAPPGLERPFFRGSSPHGDRANAGFVRARSVLAIVTLTDDDDCSAHDRSSSIAPIRATPTRPRACAASLTATPCIRSSAT
ncbi:MAG TPA: hypothetical protein VIL20_26360 [Sandaracinaceae bacterium]